MPRQTTLQIAQRLYGAFRSRTLCMTPYWEDLSEEDVCGWIEVAKLARTIIACDIAEDQD